MSPTIKTRILEIGPGRHPIPDADTVDCVGSPTYIAKWGSDPLPIDDDSYDFVFASHVLEHIPWHDSIAALREALRVLRTGGVCEMWVPDFEVVVKYWRENTIPDRWRPHNPESIPMLWVNGRLLRYGESHMWHKSLFDQRHLRYCFESAGFINVEKLKVRQYGPSHGVIDLGVSGVKPE